MQQSRGSDSVHQLAHARAFLVEHVIARMKNPARGGAWLSDLAASHRGQLLMLNVAFDAQVKALSLETCAAVLDFLPAPLGDGCNEFAVARTAFEREFLGQLSVPESNGNPDLQPEDEGYVRVLEIGNFTYYYVRPGTGRGLSAEEIGEVRRQYFGESASASFEDITQVWKGKNGRVWVLREDDFQKLMRQPVLVLTVEAGDSFQGENIRNALGLPMLSGYGPHGGPELVAVHYPPRCIGLQPRQPTSLDADWESAHVFYVSYGLVDGWGMTHSLSVDLQGCRERVHGPFQPLTAEFFGQYIGEARPLSISETDHMQVVGVAAQRYDRFLSWSSDEERA